jgi:UDP-glucose 4-epimerase
MMSRPRPQQSCCALSAHGREGATLKVLVTGGAGYVGSVVAALLIEQGHHVRVLDSLFRGHIEQLPDGAEFIQGDLTPPSLARAVTPDLDGVLHFAALSLVGESVLQPDQYWRVNVSGTQNLLDAMRAADVPRLVFSSTAATYGSPEETPITEETSTRPTNPYGASKLAVDHLITSYCSAYGLGAFSLRYFNVAGAYGRFGEMHDPETHLIPNALRAVKDSTSPLTVFGTDWPTPDGTCIRDYIHVKDLARAHVLALSACRPEMHEIANLGSGTGYSVLEVLATVEAVTGRVPATIPGGRRPGDPAVLVASNVKASDVLDWQPELGLAQMVNDAWSFMQNGTA